MTVGMTVGEQIQMLRDDGYDDIAACMRDLVDIKDAGAELSQALSRVPLKQPWADKLLAFNYMVNTRFE